MEECLKVREDGAVGKLDCKSLLEIVRYVLDGMQIMLENVPLLKGVHKLRI